MSEDKTPYTPAEAANDDLDWSIEVKDGEVWLVTPMALANLGPQDAVFSKLADVMAAADFGER